MNWFKKKFVRWIKRDWYNCDDGQEAACPDAPMAPGYSNSAKIGSSRSVDSPVRFNFTVIPASGGRIVEFNTYDHVKDRSVNTVHVIPDDTDFTHELTKIVSIELLKN